MTFSATPPRFLRTIALVLLVLATAGSVWIAGNRFVGSAKAADADGSAVPSLGARTYLPGTTAARSRTSAAHSSIMLNGSGAHVEVADAARLQLAKTLTLEAWIRPSSVSGHRHIVGKNYFELSVDPYPGGWVASMEIRSRGTWYSIASGPLQLGRWYHVAGTYDGTQLRVYVDGVLSGTERANGAIDTSDRPLRIGSADGSGDFFHGAIDEVRVSDNVRYGETFAVPAGPFAADGSTIGLWHLDEGTGDTTADASGAAHQGKLLNGAQWSSDGPWGAGPLQPPTATAVPPTVTTVPPTATAVPPTATSAPATATRVPPTATGVPPTATRVPPTATRVPPTATSIPATSVPPTAQPTAVPTSPASGPKGVTHVSTGSLGYSDVGTHQTVRTTDNRVYIFAPEIYKNYVRVLRSATTGTPSGFVETDTANRPQASSSIWAVDAAIDSRNVVHLLYIAEAGEVVYTTFDTASDRWGKPATIAASKWPNRNNDLRQGSGSIGLALDAAGVAHAVYSKTENGLRRVYYNSNTGGAWRNEQPVDAQPGNDNSHATLAFGPDGSLFVAWLSAPNANRGTLMVRARINGTWAAPSLVDDNAFANQGYSIDQGPSLIVAPNGTVHVVYVAPYERVLSQPSRYDYGRTLHRQSSDGGRSWTADDPPLRYTHNPSLWIDPQGNLVIFGHREYWLDERCASMLVTVRPAGGSWSAWRVFADGCYDASVSTRWAQFHRVAPDVLDALYWTEKGPNNESDMNQLYYAEVRGGIDALLALPPAPER